MPFVFLNPDLARVCNSERHTRERWNGAAEDVQAALIVLAEAGDLTTFGALPNVTTEGEEIVFHGRRSRVLLAIQSQQPEAGDEIVVVDVRVSTTKT